MASPAACLCRRTRTARYNAWSPVTSATWETESAPESACSTLRTITALTRTFSSSVNWRGHVARNTWVGRRPTRPERSQAGSRRSAATARTPSISAGGGRLASPSTFQPRARWARLLPTTPPAPTTSAVFVTTVPSVAKGGRN